MDLSPIGRIQKLYGKAGALAIQLYANAPKDFEVFYIRIEGIDTPFYFTFVNNKGPSKIIVRLNDFERNDWVQEWIGKEILFPTAACEIEEEEEGFEALIGYEVADKNRGPIGIIVEFLNYPNNPIYRIDHKGTDILIPIHPDFILKVDPKKKLVKTILPDGLVETYL